MTIFIHIGTPKTGTTSIQHAMFSNRKRLRSEFQINYPDLEHNHWGVLLPFTTYERYPPLQRHIFRRLGDLKKYERLGKAYIKELETSAARYSTHVLSAEQLCHHADRASLVAFHDFLSRLGHRIQVILYIRHPVEAISSNISQWLRSGQGDLASYSLDDTLTPAIQKYVSVFGAENVIIRRFGRQYFVGGELIDDFTTLIHGLPISLEATYLNGSLTGPAAYLAELSYSIAPIHSGRRALDKWFESIPGPKFHAPRYIAERVLQTHRVGLAYLESEFGVRFEDPDFSVFPEHIDWEFPREAIIALAGIVNDQALLIEDSARKMKKGKIARAIRSLF